MISVLMYAEDTVLFFSASQVFVIEETLNRELQEIGRWLQANTLFINVSKTKAMLFGTSQKLAKIDKFSLILNGTEIKRVSEFRYFGVVFDENLSWNEHIKGGFYLKLTQLFFAKTISTDIQLSLGKPFFFIFSLFQHKINVL